MSRARRKGQWLGLFGLTAALLGFATTSSEPARTRGMSRAAVTRPSDGEALSAEQGRLARTLLRALAKANDAPRGSQATDLPDEGQPHPISGDHRRLYRDADLLHAAEVAIRRGDIDGARALLDEHRRSLPGLSALDEEGLFLLADCAEELSPERVARVRSFYDQHTGSMIRRSLRRSCLERAP